MIALRQVMSYDWLRQVMCDCVALRGCGQSYHNDAKHLITFAKQNHNSYLKVHIFKEYKAKMAESIEHDLL